MRDLADSLLSHSAQRRERATQLRLAQTKQKVGLIFSWIDAFAKHRPTGVMFNDRVMAGRDIIAAERLCFAPQITKLKLFIAHHTRIRRTSRLVFAGKIIDHQALELIGFIDHIMGNVKCMRHTARIGHCLRPAAFVFRSRNAILRPHFHGHAYYLVALFPQQVSRYAGVHSTAHTKKNALLILVH